MKSIKIRKLLPLFVLGSLILACSEILLIDLTVSYPFEEGESEEMVIDVDEAMALVDQAIGKETESQVKEEVMKSEELSNLPEGSGVEISFDALSIHKFLQLINGEDVVLSASAAITAPDGSTSSKEVGVELSICDFSGNSVFEFSSVRMEIKGIKSYCPDKKGEKPYLFIEHESDDIEIKLSEEEDLQDYVKHKDKISSATINKLELKIVEAAEGFEKGSNVEIKSQLLAKAISDKNDYFQYPDENPNPDYWIGDFSNDEGFTEGSLFKLQYTYDGKKILQRAIKELDFQLGIKSFYTIYPASEVPSGRFRLNLKGEFFFSVEPLN